MSNLQGSPPQCGNLSIKPSSEKNHGSKLQNGSPTTQFPKKPQYSTTQTYVSPYNSNNGGNEATTHKHASNIGPADRRQTNQYLSPTLADEMRIPEIIKNGFANEDKLVALKFIAGTVEIPGILDHVDRFTTRWDSPTDLAAKHYFSYLTSLNNLNFREDHLRRANCMCDANVRAIHRRDCEIDTGSAVLDPPYNTALWLDSTRGCKLRTCKWLREVSYLPSLVYIKKLRTTKTDAFKGKPEFRTWYLKDLDKAESLVKTAIEILNKLEALVIAEKNPGWDYVGGLAAQRQVMDDKIANNTEIKKITAELGLVKLQEGLKNIMILPESNPDDVFGSKAPVARKGKEVTVDYEISGAGNAYTYPTPPQGKMSF